MNLLRTILAGCVASCGMFPAVAQTGFTFKGTIEGLPDSVKVALVTTDIGEGGNGKLLCETVVADQSFELRGEVQSPQLCKLQFRRLNPKTKRHFATVSLRLMVENVPMTLTSSVPYDSLRKVSYSFDQERLVHLRGGQALSQWNEYRSELYEPLKCARLAGYKSAEKYFETSDNEDTVQKYDAIKKKAEVELLAARLRFVEQNPGYYISACLMNEYLGTFYTYTTAELNKMAEFVQACPDTAAVNRSRKLLDRALRYALAEPYKDFDATTPDGKVQKLSSCVIPGHYLLVDFWASWCGPCRAAIPKVQKLREQYAGRLDVCSVSVDEKEGRWRKAMGEEKMAWTQLWLNKEQADKACTDYVVQSIPRLVLIDDGGKVVCVTFKPADIEKYLKQHLE